MKVDDIKEYFKTGYRFEQITGMSETSFQNWLRWGYVPIASQMKIERLVNGELTANLSHVKKEGL